MFIYDLLNGAVNGTDYVALNVRRPVINEWERKRLRTGRSAMSIVPAIRWRLGGVTVVSKEAVDQ